MGPLPKKREIITCPPNDIVNNNLVFVRQLLKIIIFIKIVNIIIIAIMIIVININLF